MTVVAGLRRDEPPSTVRSRGPAVGVASGAQRRPEPAVRLGDDRLPDRGVSCAVSVRSSARSRSENASDLWPSPTCAPVYTSNSRTSSTTSPAGLAAAPTRTASSTSAAGTVDGDHEGDVLLGDRERRDRHAPGTARATPPPAARRGPARTPTARAGRPSAATTFGCSSPACPTSVPSAVRQARAPPGCHGAWSASADDDELDADDLRDQPRGRDRVGVVGAPTRPPPAGGLAQPGEDAGDPTRLRRHGRVDRRELLVGRPDTAGQPRSRGRVRDRPRDQAELEDRHVARAAARRCAARCRAA